MRKYLKRHEMADLMHMSKSQLRFYEKKGILTPKMDEKGYAQYDFNDLDVLEIVSYLKELNMSIKDIKDIVTGQTPYNYERIINDSYDKVIHELEVLNRKKDMLEYQKKLLNKKELNTFKIEAFKTRVLYEFYENEVREMSIKDVYDLARQHDYNFQDRSVELCHVYEGQRERMGLLNYKENNKIIDVSKYYIEAGDYLTYVFLYDYNGSSSNEEKLLQEEADRRGLTLSDETIFIDHFGKKFYEKFKGVATISRRII